MPDAVWYCTRQRAGPLVKECRALRPRLSQEDTREDHRAKQEILRYSHSAVCRSQADRLELRLALYGYEGSHYTLTFDDEHLPREIKQFSHAGKRTALADYIVFSRTCSDAESHIPPPIFSYADRMYPQA